MRRQCSCDSLTACSSRGDDVGGRIANTLKEATKSRHFLPITILVACNLVFFGHLLFSRAIFHGSGTDLVSFQYQVLEYARGELLAGRFPLYTPYVYGGHPFYAMGQAGLTYPCNWLFHLPGTFVGIKLSVAFHAFFGSLLAYLLGSVVLTRAGHRSRVGAAGALVTGLLYGYGGFYVLHAYAGHLNLLASAAWMPGVWLGFYGLGGGCGGRGLKWVVTTGLCLSMMVLAGSPQAVYIAVLPGLLWFVAPVVGALRDEADRRWRGAAMSGMRLLGALMLGAGLSAVQWVPMLELAAWSARGQAEGGKLALSYSMPVSGIWNFIFPRFWGAADGGWWAKLSRWEFSAYLGAAPILLGLLAVVLERRRALLLGAGALFCLLLAYGGNAFLYPWLAEVVPMLAGFRVPARFVLAAVLFLGLLSGLGVATLLSGGFNRKLAALVAWGFVAVMGIFLLIMLRDPVPGFYSSYVAELSRSGRAAELAAGLFRRDLLGELVLALCVAGLVLAAPGLRKGRLAGLGRVLPALVVMLGLMAAGRGLLVGGSPGLYRLPAPAAALATTMPADGRAVHFAARGWNKLLPLRRPNIAGYDPSISAAMNMFVNAGQFGTKGLATGKTWALWPTPRTHTPSRFWDVAGVKYALVNRTAKFESADWKTMDRKGEYALLENPRAGPPWYCPSEVTVSADVRSSARAMLAPSFLPGVDAVVRLEGMAPDKIGRGACTVTPAELSPESMSFGVEAPADTLLVVGAAHYPGWRCVVDGEQSVAPAFPANLVSMGCFVPAGTHRVEFVFTSVTFRLGLALTLVALTGLIAMVIVPTIRRRRRGGGDNA